jgi:RNA polymerase sigma factor (TIGR02999 family)
MSEVTRILESIEHGESCDGEAAEALLPLVYDELRRLARQKLAHEKPGQTLQATALVHEAWLRLLGPEDNHRSWDGRGHFFAAAAEAMRRILVGNARRKHRLKRGGGVKPLDLEAIDLPIENEDESILLVNEALERFAAHDPEKARVVKLRFFAGLKHDEIADILQLSEKTVRRYWVYAKAWLYHEIRQLR